MVERMVALPSLPPHPLLTVHLLVTPPGGGEQVVVVVVPPEEHCRGEEHLLGQQALRVRLLSLFGLRVVVVPLARASRVTRLTSGPSCRPYTRRPWARGQEARARARAGASEPWTQGPLVISTGWIHSILLP